MSIYVNKYNYPMPDNAHADCKAGDQHPADKPAWDLRENYPTH